MVDLAYNHHGFPQNVKVCFDFFQLLQILVIGIKTLVWSANQQTEESEEFTFKELFFLLFTSAFFGILFFIILPLYLTKLFNFESMLLFNIVDGIFRVVVFVVYLSIISFMDDIKILFEYHGAEHKAVNCYDAGLNLNVKNCKKFSTKHPRCGTSFILIVLVISIIIFSFVITESWWIKLLARIILIPVIAGISYEILKLSAKFCKNLFFRLVITPGLWLQSLTTREPNDKQIKTAIFSLKKIIDLEQKG